MINIKRTLINKVVGLISLSMLVGCGLSDPNDRAKTFESEDGVKIIRTYEEDQSDHIFVEFPKDSGEYFTLNKYLSEKEVDKYDKEIERQKIYKLVDW